MLRWSLTIALALLLLLHALCVPFYSGASLSPSLHWRLEHARLTVKRTPPQNQESFYIAVNTEGLRFAPDFRVNGPGDWVVRLPLWLPVILVGSLTGLAWTLRLRRKLLAARHGCPSCGYPREGLSPETPCPECGAAATAKTAP